MTKALKAGRPTRYRPSGINSTKPPECAGIYYIYDAEGNNVYLGQAVNLRRRVYEHKRKGKIPEGGYVDCFKAKEGITYAELDAAEREKIDKHNPPQNQRRGGGGRKSPKLDWHSSKEPNSEDTFPTEQLPQQKRSFLYRLLGYERIDKAGEVHYKREPKAVFFLIIELIVKTLLIIDFLLIAMGAYFRYSSNCLLNQYLLASLIAIPLVCFVLFHYVRRNKLFKYLAIISFVAGIVLYLTSYPLPWQWPF